MKALTVSERSLLTNLEQRIDRGIATFIEVGLALVQIKEKGLYREEYATFEQYLNERWNLSRGRANQITEAALLAKVVSPDVQNFIHRESHVAPLADLPTPQLQRAAWAEALDSAPNGKLTANVVQRAVENVRQRHSPEAQWTREEQKRQAQVLKGQSVLCNLSSDIALIGWAQSQGLLVRIDRTSIWGNPFILDKDGTRGSK